MQELSTGVGAGSGLNGAAECPAVPSEPYADAAVPPPDVMASLLALRTADHQVWDPASVYARAT
jgi:hypothetical protein